MTCNVCVVFLVTLGLLILLAPLDNEDDQISQRFAACGQKRLDMISSERLVRSGQSASKFIHVPSYFLKPMPKPCPSILFNSED